MPPHGRPRFSLPCPDGSAASACTVPGPSACACGREQTLAEHSRRAGDGVNEKLPTKGSPSPYPARIRSYFQFREIGAEIFIELVNGLKSHLRIQFLRVYPRSQREDTGSLRAPAPFRQYASSGSWQCTGAGNPRPPAAVHADIPIGCENIAVTHQLPAQIRSKVGQFFPGDAGCSAR